MTEKEKPLNNTRVIQNSYWCGQRPDANERFHLVVSHEAKPNCMKQIVAVAAWWKSMNYFSIQGLIDGGSSIQSNCAPKLTLS
jgi:hypothetical protein